MQVAYAAHLRTDSLKGGIVYYDGVTDDARLTLEMRADSILRLIMASIAIAGIAAILPIRQIAGLDPAMVYRGGGR